MSRALLQDEAAGIVEAPRVLKTGESGRVPVEWLVENPKNPRLHFNDDELTALADLIKEGGQREVITVRELTPDERTQYPGAFYMVVSGARRLRSLRLNGALYAEIRVRAYASDAEEQLEAFLLNEGRVGLSDYELMHRLEMLAGLHGWDTIEAIARHTGVSAPKVGYLRAIYRAASPVVIERMHPRYPQKKRLRLNVAYRLSQFDLDAQEALLKKIPATLESAAAQAAWLEKKAHAHGVTLERRKRNPRETRRLVRVLADIAYRKAKVLLHDDLSRLAENAKPGELQTIAQEIESAIAVLEKLRKKVVAAAVLPAPAASEVVALPETKPMPPPRQQGNGSEHMPAPSPAVPSVRVRPSNGGMASSQLPRQTASMFPQQGVVYPVWDPQEKRFFTKRLMRSEYQAAARAGLLEYQHNGKPRPNHLPDPDKL